MAHLGLMLSRLALMVQAAVLDSQFLDPFSPFNDGGVSAEVGIGGGDVAEALVVAVVVIVIDESADLAFKVPRQIIVFQQDAVLQRLMPALDLALSLRVIRRAACVVHSLAFYPSSKITGNVA